jgi:hypothetical protein
LVREGHGHSAIAPAYFAIAFLSLAGAGVERDMH